MNWKFIFLLPVLTIALMGQSCPEQDTSVRSLLGNACPAVNVAYEHYVAARDLVSKKTQDRVELVKSQFDRLCANPESATTVTVLASASAAFLAIRAAIAEGRSANATSSTFSHTYAYHLNELEGMTNRAEKALEYNFNAMRR